MQSLTSRSIVLIFARLSNYAALMLSPIFLVRLLDVESYGQYREFVLYALLIATILGFGIKGNLLYFIPKNKDNEHAYTSNSITFIFLVSSLGLSLLLLLSNFLSTYISFDFISILACYVFFYLNLDLVESYWLAKKKSGYVFLYSTTVLVIRMSVVILTAYFTRDVIQILYAMTITESIKFLALFFWWKKYQHISFSFNKEIASQQIKYIAPLGIGGLIGALNLKFGGVFIASMIGTSALAVYSIGIYQIPVLAVVRSAISDVIFPDMVEKNETDENQALEIWKRANIVFCLIVFPVFFIFWIFAEKFITFMFTIEYIDSTPIFQLMLLLMIRRCFELGTPLRSKNKNHYFFRGNILALIANIILTLLLFEQYGLVAPAIAFVLSDVIMAIYLTQKIKGIYQITFSALFMWGKVSKILFASVAGLPLLWLGDTSGSFIYILLSTTVYLLLYYFIIKMLRLDEAEIIVQKVYKVISIKR